MTFTLLAWVLSAAGATLFFVAGKLMAGARRSPAAMTGAAAAVPADDQTLTDVPTGPALLALAFPAASPPAAPASRPAPDPAPALEAERLQREIATARAALDERARKLAHTERALDEVHGRLRETEERLAGSETRLGAAISPEAEQTLRQDLAIKNDQLATRAQAVRRLEAENAKLRQDLAAQTPMVTEVEWLRADNAKLRAQTFAATARPIPRGKPLDLDGTPGVSRGSVLQSLVERVSRLGDVRCAVIADDLGLVVASHGELSDEVAAVAALFSRAGQQAQSVLPLENVERVTVEDSLGLTLALRPLPAGRQGDPDLALITLAVGAALDQRALNKLIDEGPRLAPLP